MSAVEKMTFCPEFRYANDVAILMDAFSYADRCLSYCAISCFSLLKCCKEYSHSQSNQEVGRKYLNCLVVNQGIDRHGCCTVICRIRLSSEPCSAFN